MLDLVIYKTFVTLQSKDPDMITALNYICSKMTTYNFIFNKKIKKNIPQKDKCYYAVNKETNLYRFPIGMLKDIMYTLGGYGVNKADVNVSYAPKHEIAPIEFDWNDYYIPRDYQNEYVDAVIDGGPSTILIDLKTGGGKGLIGMRILWHMKYRTAVLVLPKYIDKWISDIKMYSNVTDDEIYVVQGSDSLKKLCNMSKEELTYKFIIFSMTTITYYINNYEENILDPSLPTPDMLMQHLGIGILFNDESHQHFHALFKAVLYFKVELFLGMSATLVSFDKTLERMYKSLFPDMFRISNLVKHEPYVNVEAVSYRLQNGKGVKYKGVKGYSHATFEKYIMFHNLFLRNYVELIDHYFNSRYMAYRKENDRCLIYCTTINMCTIVANYLKSKYKNLSIGTYVENDDYSSIMNNDVSVSTLGSASTGLDIKNLITVINTISVTSIQSNLQSLGRLRKIEGKELWYVYLYCSDIPTQIKMHKNRRAAIIGTVKQYFYTTHPKEIKVK